MFKTLTTALVALAAVGLLAGPAAAQSTMIRGKVVDKEGKPVPNAAVAVEFKGGVNRKYQTKSDKGGDFVQLLTESGEYQVTVTAEGIGSQSAPVRVRLGQAADVNIVLAPGGGGTAIPRPPRSRRPSRRAWPPAAPATTTRRSPSSTKPPP